MSEGERLERPEARPLSHRGGAMRSTDMVVIALLFAGGCALNALIYGSLEPLGAALVFLTLSLSWVGLTGGDAHEVRMLCVAFGVGWLMAGSAAAYVAAFGDPFQTTSDPARFYLLATTSRQVPLKTLLVLSEGAGAIIVWRAVYAVFADLGFTIAPYLGILVNITCVALTGVITVRMTRLMYPGDDVRLRRVTIVFAACGLFWLFAALHLRDAFVLFAVTLLAYYWVKYLARRTRGALLQLVVATIASVPVLAILRREFLFVPVAMLLAGTVASTFFGSLRGSRKWIAYGLAFIGVVVAAYAIATVRGGADAALANGAAGYLTQAQRTANSESLGMRLIVKQPLPVRVVLGSVYLYLFPIPFWAGVSAGSMYELFKSLNVLFFYVLVPLVALAGIRLWCDRAARTPQMMFLVFLVCGFTAAIAATSLETRHLGSFLVPLLVVAMLPDLSRARDRRRYGLALSGYLILIVGIHLAWAVAKI